MGGLLAALVHGRLQQRSGDRSIAPVADHRNGGGERASAPPVLATMAALAMTRKKAFRGQTAAYAPSTCR